MILTQCNCVTEVHSTIRRACLQEHELKKVLNSGPPKKRLREEVERQTTMPDQKQQAC